MKRVVKACSADSWHLLLVAMNKQTDEVKVRTSAVVDVGRCHEQHVSRDLIVRERGRWVIVRRNQLWDLVQAHGRICE